MKTAQAVVLTRQGVEDSDTGGLNFQVITLGRERAHGGSKHTQQFIQGEGFLHLRRFR